MKRRNQDTEWRGIIRKTIKLDNAIFRDRHVDAKIYMDDVSLAVGGYWFECRKVFLRFSSGPDIDLTIEDMDRLVSKYLKIRGIELPRELTKRKKWPIQADFCVTVRKSKSAKGCTHRMGAKNRNRKTCARCGRAVDYSSEWYGELCPNCADETDGYWVCRECGRRGLFEAMGGSGGNNPICCGLPCEHVGYGE